MTEDWTDRFDDKQFVWLENSFWLESLINLLWLISVAISMFLPVVLAWHYWYLASGILLKCLFVVGVVAASLVLFLCRMIGTMNPKLQSAFCIVLLPTVIIQTFIMWKVFGFNLLFVALPYGVVAAVLILIKFLVSKDDGSGEVVVVEERRSHHLITKKDIIRYNGMFHVFSLSLVALSMFPVCAIKILRGATQFSKLAKDIFLFIAMIGSVVFVCGVAAFSWMLGRGVFMNDRDWQQPQNQALVQYKRSPPAEHDFI